MRMCMRVCVFDSPGSFDRGGSFDRAGEAYACSCAGKRVYVFDRGVYVCVRQPRMCPTAPGCACVRQGPGLPCVCVRQGHGSVCAYSTAPAKNSYVCVCMRIFDSPRGSVRMRAYACVCVCVCIASYTYSGR
nr:MAG TPA: hypothetical protein [Caudoviricetes sp.]